MHTHASARLCDMQTGSENRAMAQNKGQCFSLSFLSFFDAQIRRQEFRFLLKSGEKGKQTRRQNEATPLDTKAADAISGQEVWLL